MKTSIVWFRKSLRLHDNPALTAACENENVDSILPIYILDPDTVGENYQKWSPNRLRFLIESLSDLDHQLSSQYGSRLFILQGNPNVIFENIADQLGQTFHSINCEYCSEPWDRKKFSSLQNLVDFSLLFLCLTYMFCFFVFFCRVICLTFCLFFFVFWLLLTL